MPSGYKVQTVSPQLSILGYVRNVVSNRQGVMVITDCSTQYFSSNQQLTQSIDWNGKMSWLNLPSKFPSVSVVIVSHSMSWVASELARKFHVPVVCMNSLTTDLNSDEVYALLNAYIIQVSKLKLLSAPKRFTYVKSSIRTSSKFKSSRRTAKVLVRNNYPFVSHTGFQSRRARISGRLPKP